MTSIFKIKLNLFPNHFSVAIFAILFHQYPDETLHFMHLVK